MRGKHSPAACALLLAALPLLGSTCTEEKLVDLVIGFPTTVTLQASGELNTHDDANTVDVKADLDLAGGLADAGIDPSDLAGVKLIQVFYRVSQPDPVADRTIRNGTLTVARVVGGIPQAPSVLVSGWTMPAGAGNVADPAAWIDITGQLGPAGISLLNDLLAECVAELRGEGPAVADPEIRYEVQGDSEPADQPTGFTYEIRLLFQGTVQESFDIPFG